MTNKTRDNPDYKAQARLASALADLFGTRLAGLDPGVQGAVVAQLQAIWLCGHQVPGDAEATQKAREAVLLEHNAHMWKMVAHFDQEQERGAPKAEAGAQ